MPTHPRPRLLAAALLLPTLAACAADRLLPLEPDAVRATRAATAAAGGVYTMTNGSGGNAILAYRRAADGALTALGAVATGGLGTGGTIDPLVSQYALVLGDDNRLLFAVNAGSDDVSSFRVGADGALTLADRAPSGGDLPVSVAAHGRLLYVLNAGDATLRGFRAAASGTLVSLPHADRALAAGAAGAAAVRFTPDGRFLIVSERVSNRLEVFPVQPDGRLGEPILTPSHGAAAFGFDVTAANTVIVSETSGFASSYHLTSGVAALVSASVPTFGAAPCWVIATADGRFAYVVNAGTATLTGYAVGAGGALTLLDADGTTASTGSGSTPLDLDLTEGDAFLYVLEAGSGTIGAFAVNADGSLSARPDTPAGAAGSGQQGLAAF
jgi:6-phosphogluconolactonase